MKEFNPLAMQDPSWDERFRRGRDEYEATARKEQAAEADAKLQRYLSSSEQKTGTKAHG